MVSQKQHKKRASILKEAFSYQSWMNDITRAWSWRQGNAFLFWTVFNLLMLTFLIIGCIFLSYLFQAYSYHYSISIKIITTVMFIMGFLGNCLWLRGLIAGETKMKIFLMGLLLIFLPGLVLTLMLAIPPLPLR